MKNKILSNKYFWIAVILVILVIVYLVKHKKQVPTTTVNIPSGSRVSATNNSQTSQSTTSDQSISSDPTVTSNTSVATDAPATTMDNVDNSQPTDMSYAVAGVGNFNEDMANTGSGSDSATSNSGQVWTPENVNPPVDVQSQNEDQDCIYKSINIRLKLLGDNKNDVHCLFSDNFKVIDPSSANEIASVLCKLNELFTANPKNSFVSGHRFYNALIKMLGSANYDFVLNSCEAKLRQTTNNASKNIVPVTVSDGSRLMAFNGMGNKANSSKISYNSRINTFKKQ